MRLLPSSFRRINAMFYRRTAPALAKALYSESAGARTRGRNLPGKLDLALDAAHVKGMVHKGDAHRAPVSPALLLCAPVSSRPATRSASKTLGISLTTCAQRDSNRMPNRHEHAPAVSPAGASATQSAKSAASLALPIFNLKSKKNRSSFMVGGLSRQKKKR